MDTTSRTKVVYPTCVELTGQTFSDQTDQFIVPFTSRNKYVFLLYDYDSNYIMAVPIESRTKLQIIAAFKSYIAKLKACGLAPMLHTLDNKPSDELEKFMSKENIKCQFTPTGSHCRNIVEREI